MQVCGSRRADGPGRSAASGDPPKGWPRQFVAKNCTDFGKWHAEGSACAGYRGGVEKEFLRQLQARRAEIRTRWNELLHTEAASSPLAHPDTLVHLIDWSLAEIMAAVEGPANRRQAAPKSFEAVRALCPCGRNPLLAMFQAGEQAVTEGLILCQAENRAGTPVERGEALAEVLAAVRTVAAMEVESFCAVCQHRGRALNGGCGAVADHR